MPPRSIHRYCSRGPREGRKVMQRANQATWPSAPLSPREETGDLEAKWCA